MKPFISVSELDTEQIAKNFAITLHKGNIIAFKGNLGSGKTTFIKYMIKYLDFNIDQFCSPTYNILNKYTNKSGLNIYHFDMYRVSNLDELYSTGYFDYIDQDNIIAIEWSEKIIDFLPNNTIYVSIHKVDKHVRSIDIKRGNYDNISS